MAESFRGLTRLRNEIEKAKESLKDVDENIKKLTGRDPTIQRPVRYVSLGISDTRGAKATETENRICSLARRGILPDDPTFRRRVGGAFSRLGPRPGRDRGDRGGQDSGDDEDLPHKPALQSSVIVTTKDEKSRQNSIEEQSRDRLGQARNKRMFGLLLGTLQRFKHESEETKEKEEQRHKIEKKLEDKFKQEKEEVLRERRQLFLERKQKQYRIRLLEQKMEMARNHGEWEIETRKLDNFIRTKAKPHLFYMPKIATVDSETLLKETKTAVDEMIEDRRKKLEEEITDLMSRVHRSAGGGDTGDDGDDNEGEEDGEESEGVGAEHGHPQRDQSPEKYVDDKENRDKHANGTEQLSQREQRDREREQQDEEREQRDGEREQRDREREHQDRDREQRGRDREQRDRDRQMRDKRQTGKADHMERERKDSGKGDGVERSTEHDRSGGRDKNHVRHRDKTLSHSNDHNRERHRSGKSRSDNRKHGEEKSHTSKSKHKSKEDRKAEKLKVWAPMEDEEEEEFMGDRSGVGEKGVSIQSKMLKMAGMSAVMRKEVKECESMEINLSQSVDVAEIPTPAGVYMEPTYGVKDASSGNMEDGSGNQT